MAAAVSLPLARLDAARAKRARPLSNAARRVRSPRPPTAAEMMLVKAARQLVSAYARALWSALAPKIPDFARQPRADAKGSEVKAVTSHMRAVARRALNRGLPAFEARSKVAASRAQNHSQKELERLGLKVKDEPELKHLIDGWRKDTVARIKGLADHQLAQIEKVLTDAENRDPDVVAEQLKGLVAGVSDRRAEFIARDQILTLNSKINSHRQQAAGVTSYIWTTQHDSRVRESHADLDGEEFDWDSGGDPEEGHPGDPPNCRCLAYPNPPPEDAEDVEDRE